MLAGRAWQFFLFPFTHVELGERFKLDDVVLRGTLPPIIEESHEDGFRSLTAYVQTYLKEEILDEAIVRNIGAFSRFLDMAADQSALYNYSGKNLFFRFFRKSAPKIRHHDDKINAIICLLNSVFLKAIILSEA